MKATTSTSTSSTNTIPPPVKKHLQFVLVSLISLCWCCFEASSFQVQLKFQSFSRPRGSPPVADGTCTCTSTCIHTCARRIFIVPSQPLLSRKKNTTPSSLRLTRQVRSSVKIKVGADDDNDNGNDSSSNNSGNNGNTNGKGTKRRRYHDLDLASSELDKMSYGGMFDSKRGMLSRPYVSNVVKEMDPASQASFLSKLDVDVDVDLDSNSNSNNSRIDPLWEQVKLEALHTLENEPSAGPQLYTLILSQPSLLSAITSIVSHEIETELIPATSLQNLFTEMLLPDTKSQTHTRTKNGSEDKGEHTGDGNGNGNGNGEYNDEEDIDKNVNKAIELDVMKAAMRSSSSEDGTALNSILFHQGLHALVCHRLSHRLWNNGRTGLAYYIQSTVSRKYSTDIHPAAKIGRGVYLNAGSAGVVIGETAVIDHDVTVLQGVTLGGTGKERGDRHPKVRRGVILQQSCSVLGNIVIGEGAVITAKSIVTKPVPAFARVSGVPGKVKSYVQTSSSPSVSSPQKAATTTTINGGMKIGNKNSQSEEFVSNDSDSNSGGTYESGSLGLYGRQVFEDTDELSELEKIMMQKYLQFWNESIIDN